MESELIIKLSDHNTVRVNLISSIGTKDKDENNLQYLTEVPLYNWRHGSKEDWIKYKEALDDHNWELETRDLDMDQKLKHLHDILQEGIAKVFRKKDFKKSQRKIPRAIKKMFTQKKKLSDKILKSKSPSKINMWRAEFVDLENRINASYMDYRNKEELK